MSHRSELERALDACLEQMASQGVHVDAALSGFPELADELRPSLELVAGLARLPEVPGPSDDFRAQLAAALESAPLPASLMEGRAQAPEQAPAVAPTKLPLTTPIAGSATVLGPDSGLAPTALLVRVLDAALDSDADPLLVLEEHPELERELAPLVDLAAALREMRATEAPDAAFRGELAAAIAQAPQPRSVTTARPPLAGLGWLRALWRSTAITAASAATIIIFLVAGLTYASADALPGNVLYPVKRTAERARLLLAQGEAELALHQALADTRLFEALSAPPFAGEALADFSREVTAALVVADGMIARGDSRDDVAPPLLIWLLSTRSHLVDGRPNLPPTAWRASLALCDEAIAALRSGASLAVAPVPRLADPAAVLARRYSPREPDLGTVAWRSRRSGDSRLRGRSASFGLAGLLDSEPVPMDDVSRPGESTGLPAPAQVAMAGGAGGAGNAAGSGGAAPAGGAAADAGSSGAYDSGAGDGPESPWPGSGDGALPEPTQDPAPTSAPGGSGSEPTSPPGRPVPSNTPYNPHPTPTDEPPEPPATSLPPGTATPPAPPTQMPPETPVATDAPTQTAAPTAGPATPTSLPTVPVSPTVPVMNKLPVINDVRCDSQLLDLYKATTCHVTAYDPEGEELHYFWIADAPQMLNERQKDATYYAAWGVGGGTLRVRVTVYVSDEGPAAPDDERIVSGETYVDVRSLASNGSTADGGPSPGAVK